VRKTRRRLTFEYVLLADVNDAPEHAAELVRAVRGDGSVPLSLFHVNLIPVNRGPGGFRRPADDRMEAFAEILRRGGLAASVRISRGQDIAAGCGQLRTEVDRKRARAASSA
jgi:23S rRNA (adenine2503-C2)-methyltransferase